MTKSVLIEKIAEKVDGLSKKQTEVVVETIFESIKESLAKGGKVEIRGFGNFRLRSRKARKARNPKTGRLARMSQNGRLSRDVDTPKRTPKTTIPATA